MAIQSERPGKHAHASAIAKIQHDDVDDRDIGERRVGWREKQIEEWRMPCRQIVGDRHIRPDAEER
jgi:hypothetical protein